MQGWKKAVAVMLTVGTMAGFVVEAQARFPRLALSRLDAISLEAVHAF